MYNGVTYCNNSECKKRHKCKLYTNKDKKINGQDFWTDKYNPDNCPTTKGEK